MKEAILVIVNPSSGKSNGIKNWAAIKPLLVTRGMEFHCVLTTQPKDATIFTKKNIEKGYRKILVIGGDGTLNEVVNGIMTQKACGSLDISLALIPNGTGNDFGRNFKLTNQTEAIIDLLRVDQKQTIDLGLVHYRNEKASQKTYFINMLGFGFDVAVTKNVNELAKKGYKSVLSYLYCMIKTVIDYKKQDVTIVLDGKEHHFPKTFSICIANGKYHGGGVPQAPNADPSDGKFHITTLHDLKNLEAFLNLPQFYSGKFMDKYFASELIGKNIELLCKNSVEVELDGEILDGKVKSIEIIPQAINFIRP